MLRQWTLPVWRTCLSVMRGNAVQIVFFAFALVLAAALQDMSPAVCGAKVALLQAVAFRVALTRRLVPSLVCAVAAGGMCDALSALPGFCTSGFQMSVCVVVALIRGTDQVERRKGRRGNADHKVQSAPVAALLFAAVASAGELWTRIWLWRLGPSLFGGMAFAAAAGFLAELVAFALMDSMERLCGIPHDFAEGGEA